MVVEENSSPHSSQIEEREGGGGEGEREKEEEESYSPKDTLLVIYFL
jgi:hypothetical protein